MPVKSIPIGQRFGKLTIIGASNTHENRGFSACQCDCGNTKEILNSSLRRGVTTSCGCYHAEVSRAKAIHGYNRDGQRHPIYDVWNAMKQRCQNPNNPAYVYYGGRGIEVCERWRDFSNFVEDMLPGYQRHLTLERIHNDKGYSKDNCKWETRRGQMLNRRGAHLLTLNGETLNMSVWAERLGVSFGVISSRVGKLGWSVKRALTTPLMNRGCK